MSSAVHVEQLDCAIDVLLSDPDVAIPNVDSTVAELLGVAAELRTLPRPDFRSQLKLRLMNGGLGHPELTLDAVSRVPVIKRRDARQEQILPTLFGSGYGTYAVRRSNFALSVAAHAVALMLVLTSSFWMVSRHLTSTTELVQTVPDVSEYVRITPISSPTHGGGGGGDRDKVLAPQGRLPKAALEQMTPPEVIVRNAHPQLSVEPTVVTPPQLHLSNNMPNLGDPKSPVLGPPSNGTGAGAGIGNGNGGGVGAGYGSGVGPGIGGGYGGGIFSVGGGVTSPRVLYKPEPEYSIEARQAKHQGTVVVRAVVATDGKAHNLQIVRSLGMGLDEKALEAVQQWRFEPATKDGKAVAVYVDIEVNFHLY